MHTAVQRLRKSQSATRLTIGHHKRVKVHGDKKHRSAKRILMKPHHMVAYDGKQGYITETAQPAPSTTLLDGTSPYSFIIENDAVGLMRDAVFRFDITATAGDCVLAPCTVWWDRVEYWDRHSNREIARYYGDTMHWMLWTFNQDTVRNWAPRVGMDPETGGPWRKRQTSVSRYYYLPVPHSWLDAVELDLSILRGDLEIKFYPKGDPKYSNNGVTLSLNGIHLVSGTEMMSRQSRGAHVKSHMSNVMQHNFLDCQQYVDSGKTMTNSTKYTFNLDQFHHESAFLAIVLRDSTDGVSNTAGVERNYYSIGAQGEIDHENVHGQSLLGQGTPVREDYLRAFVSSRLFQNNSYSRNNAVYIIPYTKDIQGALEGHIDGFHSFVGDRERIAITTGIASVSEVQTITTDADLTATEVVQLGWKGEFTPPLSAATAIAGLKSAFEALGTVQRDNLSVTFVSTFDAANTTPITVTIDRNYSTVQHADDAGGELIQVITGDPLAAGTGGATDQTTVSITTEATPGFLEAAATNVFDTYIYSFYYRQSQLHEGRLEVQDI